MNSKLFYRVMSGFYDLIDVIYFGKYETSPRKIVCEAIKDGDMVLDICTGTATNAISIGKKNQYSKVVGVDLSEDMLIIAKSKVKKANLSNIQLYRMDAAQLSFEDGYFDKVLLSLVLHEIDGNLAEKIINEAIRVLKPDGEIIIAEWERCTEFLKKIMFLPIELLEPKSYKTFMIKNLHTYFQTFGLYIVDEIHCDYSKVLRLKNKV